VVATILSLRWRILIHQFQRDWWRLLFVVAGLVWSVSIVPLLVVGSQQLAFENIGVRHDALVLVSGLLGAAWIVVPLLATGVDDSLDPHRFAPWGVNVRRIMPGLAAAAFSTVPALFFVAVGGVMVSVWHTVDGAPLVMVLGAVGALATVASWVFGARVAVLWATRALASRVGRLLIAAIICTAVVLLVGAALIVRASGLEDFFSYEVPGLITGWSRTPVAAGFAAAGMLAAGEPYAATWRLAIAICWAAVLYVAWRGEVARALVQPVARSGGSRRISDGILAAVGSSPAASAGLRGLLFSPQTAVIRARLARSWATDSRHLAQLIGAVLFPVIGGGMAVVVAGGAGAWIAALPVALALGIGWGRHNDLAYDSSAIWLDIVSGVKGRRVLMGRMLATSQWAVPIVVAASLAAAAIASRWDVALPVAAASIGVLGVAYGVATVTSVLLPYRVPAPGQSPFGSDAGAIGASLVGQAVSSLGTGVLVPVVAGPLVAAFVWGGAWWAVTVAAGLLIGPAAAVGGMMLAGSLYDQRSGRLIGALS